MEYSIHDRPERAGVFAEEGIHERLSFVINCYKNDPWKAKEKGKPIQDKERGKGWFFIIFPRPVEPEDLR